jgi:hypothetical protein
VENIVRFGLCALDILVHQHDFPPHAAHYHRVGRGRADHSAADNPDFHRGTSLLQKFQRRMKLYPEKVWDPEPVIGLRFEGTLLFSGDHEP